MKALSLLITLGLSFQLLALTISPKISTPEPDDTKLTFKLSSKLFDASNIGSYTHKKLLKCVPEILGAYEFTSQNSLTLFPSHTLKAGTSYSCRLNKTSYTPKSTATSFTTKKLYAVIERFGKMISLRFNTSINPKKVKNSLKISRTKNLAQTDLHFTLTANKNKKHFIALIQEAVISDEITVTINASVSKSLTESISEKLSAEKSPAAKFDPKLKTMTITGNPRFVAQANGKLAIRLYLPHYFYSSTPIRPFIAIKGLDTFFVGSPNYLYSNERNKYGISKDNQRYVDISGDFQSGKNYDITIKKGLKAAYNYQLRHNQSFSVIMGDRKQHISFESDKPYLSSAGEVGIESVNTEKATIVVEHLLDQNYRYFVNFNKGNGGYLQGMSTEVARKTFSLGGEKNKFSKHKINIKSFMKKFKSGVYRLTIHYNGDKKTSKSVYFSDIGITAKVANNQMFVWSTKLSDSSPLNNAKVKIYSYKNELLHEASTDDDGVAIIDLKRLAFKNPKTIVISTDDEQSFLYLDKKLNGASTPYTASQSKKYKTFIYLQSKLIRPGNDAHILMLLKDKNFLSASNLPLQVKITDPTGYTVYDRSLKTSNHGAIDLKLFIEETFKTGKYRIAIKMGKYTIGRGSFSVENFIPQKIKNKISFDKKALNAQELLHATVSSRYLFGAPASNLKAQARLTAVSKVYFNANYKGFNFNNEILAASNITNYLLRSKTVKLNKKGEAKLIFDTKISQNPPSMLQAQLALTVFDDNRGVATYKSIDIYPYKTMVGVKLDNASIEKGEKLTAKSIVLEPKKGKKLSRKLEVVIRKSSWEHYYDARGYYKWNKRYHEQNRFYINSGDPVELTMPNSGDYTIELADRLSGHSTTRNFRVSGWDYTPIDPTSDMAKIQLTIDKKRLAAGFKQGDTLHVDIKSPLTKGHMLLSLESDKVLWHKVIKINKGSATLNIDLNFPISNGAYLRTHMVRATDTPSTLIPFRASSVTHIKADKTAHRQTVHIDAPKLTTSSHMQTINITAKPKSSVIISVVDEGILQIKGQQAPKPFEFFERVMQEQIALYDLYEKVMHYKTKGKLLSFGAGGLRKMKRSRKHLGLKTGAKRVKPFVYWSKVVTTDAQGKVSVKLPIPSFNGQAQIVALCFDKSSVGTASQPIVIKDDIIIKPTFPRFVHIKDAMKVPVRVFNTSKETQTLNLSIKTSQQLSFDLNATSLTLAPNSSQLISATLKGKSFGKGEVSIHARSSANKSFHTNMELPVRSSFALETKVYKGETSKPLSISIDPKYFGDTKTQLYINISDSYLSQLQGTLNSLIGYPHGCTEQTTSKLLGMLYIQKFVKGANDQHTKDLLADRKRFIQEGIYKLHGMQKHQGEFGYWQASGYINPYASIYASDVILELQRQGFNIPPEMISKVYKALRNQSKGYGNYRYGSLSHFERIYAAYLLSREGQLDIATANTLYDQKIYKTSLVSHYMMAAILKQAQLTTALNTIFAELEGFHYNQLSQTRLYGGSFYSKSRDLSFALYLHLTHFKKNELSKRLFEAVKQEAKHIYSTQDKAFLMRAMVAYYGDTTSEVMKLNLTLNKTKTSHKKPFTQEAYLQSPIIEIKPTQGVVNYAFEVSNYIYKPKRDIALKRQSTPVKIYRSFVDEKDNIVNPASLIVGDLFYSKITISSDKKIENLVVSNRIPACFEIINERLENHKRSNKVKNSLNFKPDYQDFLDDKVLTFLNLVQPARYYDNISRSNLIRNNTQTFYQAMRILSQGSCQFPAVLTEAMYDARVTAYSKRYDEIKISSVKKQKSKFKLTDLLQKW